MSARHATGPLREALARALLERPSCVELWDGSTLAPTNGAGGPTFRLHSPRALGHVLRAHRALGLGRAYVSGDIEVDGFAPPLNRSKVGVELALRQAPSGQARKPPTAATAPRGGERGPLVATAGPVLLRALLAGWR